MFNAVRPMGVKIPDMTVKGQGPPNTVTHVMPCNFFAVGYFDNEGANRTTVVMKVGNKLYVPPNAEDWAKALTGSQEWFQKAVFAHIPKDSEIVPIKDNVDVMMAAEKVVNETEEDKKTV